MKFKKGLKYLFFLGITVGLMFLYGFSAKKNSQKKIDNIVVEFEPGENNFLTHSMVGKLLIQNNKTVKNQVKSKLNLYGLENSVSKNPYVEKAAVFYTIGGVLKSIIKQRSPIARIMAENNSYYIDNQGLKIPLSNNYSARVLLVSGIKNEENSKEILPLIRYVLGDEFLEKEIVSIEKLKGGDFRFSVRSGTYKIYFGKLTKVDVKFNKLKAFYNKTFVDKTITKYKTINLKYHNQVVCTK